MSTIPRYRVSKTCFVAPYLLHPGSEFSTNASPSPNWLALNEAAHAKFAEWYEEEIPDKDFLTGKPVLDNQGRPVMVKPHYQYRPVEYVGGEAHEVVVHNGPPKEQPGELDLSLAAARALTDPRGFQTDQRPGPELTPVRASVDGEVSDIIPAPPPSSKQRALHTQ